MATVMAPPRGTAPEYRTLEETERRCRQDFAYAASGLLHIKPKDEPLMRLRLNWPQTYIYERYMLPAWQRREPLALVILKARREGVSTLCAAWQFHKARWWRGQNCYQTAHDEDTAKELFDMVLRFHDNLPDLLKPPTRHRGRSELEYGAPWDSQVQSRVAKYLDIGRGKTIHHAHLSEAAYYPDPETIFGGILDAVPSSGPTSMILETTAAGADTWFESVWELVERGERAARDVLGGRHWQACFLPWFWNPWNVAQVSASFQLDAPERELQREYQLRPEQLAWRRNKIAEFELLHPGQGARLFQQEHPKDSSEAFLLSGQCVFPDDAMERLKTQRRPPTLGFQVVRIGQWRQALVRDDDLEHAALQVWEPPRRGYQYTVGVDVSRGGGRDDSAVVVLRMPEFVQVAHWVDNYTAPKQLAYTVAAIARYYGAGSGTLPCCIVEVNDAGILVNAELETMRGVEPLDIYVWEYFDKVGQQQTTKTGWVTTWATKNIMIGMANSLLVARMVTVPSTTLQIDMQRTVEIKPSVYRTGGCDVTVAWLLAVVAAWRKIARWEWLARDVALPAVMAPYPDDRSQGDAGEGGYRDPALYDGAWRRVRERGREDFLGAGAVFG